MSTVPSQRAKRAPTGVQRIMDAVIKLRDRQAWSEAPILGDSTAWFRLRDQVLKMVQEGDMSWFEALLRALAAGLAYVGQQQQIPYKASDAIILAMDTAVSVGCGLQACYDHEQYPGLTAKQRRATCAKVAALAEKTGKRGPVCAVAAAARAPPADTCQPLA